MIARRTSRALARWAAFAALVGLLSACPSRRQGIDGPDLERRNRETSRRLARTRKIREVMTRDLDEFRDLAGRLRDPPAGLFRGSFPLDLFKHVVVECLNAPATAEPGSAASAAEGRPTPDSGLRSGGVVERGELACATRFVGELEDRLGGQSDRTRERAFELLRSVDRFHTLRIRLRRRLASIEEIVESTRSLLATRRADLRKLRRRWRERKSELRAARWQQLQDRFDALDRDLEQLDRATDRLESAAREWPEAIDRANRRVYFAITSRWNLGD